MCNADDERASKTKYRKVKKNYVKAKRKTNTTLDQDPSCALAALTTVDGYNVAASCARIHQEVALQLSAYYDHLAKWNSSKLVWALIFLSASNLSPESHAIDIAVFQSPQSRI